MKEDAENKSSDSEPGTSESSTFDPAMFDEGGRWAPTPEREERQKRPGLFDSKFNILTLDELIEFVKTLNNQFPHVNRMGLYIEMNSAWQYAEDFEINVERRLWKTLESHQLHTRSLCVKNNLPIIIKSFDSFNLEHFTWEYDPQEHFPHAETIVNPINGTKRH